MAKGRAKNEARLEIAAGPVTRRPTSAAVHTLSLAVSGMLPAWPRDVADWMMMAPTTTLRAMAATPAARPSVHPVGFSQGL